MKQYRKSFVRLNMLLIGILLLLMMAVVAVYMYRDYERELRFTMEQVVGPLDRVSAPQGSAPMEWPEGGPWPGGRTDDKNRRSVMAVLYEPEEEEYVVLSRTSFLDEDTLEDVLEEIEESREASGTLSEYGVLYYRSGLQAPYKIALASTSTIGRSMAQLVGTLALIWIGTMLCFFGVSVLLSRRAVRPMEEAMRREKQFIADASHDLKTPLSVILANNDILLESPLSTIEEQRRWIDSTGAAAKNMQRLISEMLTLSDAEREDTPLALETADVSALVQKTALQMESVAYEKGVTLDMDVPDGVTIRTNADYFARITASLMENAIKYEPDGGEVFVSLKEEHRQARLSVLNRGSVIAPEDLPHVFERFYRADKSRGTASGHGLGLAITKQMTERLGGSLAVESAAGTGTVFTAVFPIGKKQG